MAYENTSGSGSSCCDWQQKYNDLLQKTTNMEKEIMNLKKRLNGDKKEVRSHCQYFYKQETSSKTQMNQLKDKVETLGNIVIRLEERLQESENKLIEMQARSMRKNLIISGIEEPKNETSEQLLQSVNNFITSKLKIQEHIPIKVYHRLNYVDGSEYRPVIIKLRTVEHKYLLLSHATNLKGLQNDRNRYFYLNEQLPEKLAEDRRYAHLWIKENKSKPDDQKLQMKIHKNKLRVNNQPYSKKVNPPNAAEIIRMEPEEIVAVKQASTVFGDSQMVECSEFISYAAKITKVEEVRVAYRKLRMKYADATHISSAYRLDPTNGPYNQEGLDDGEYGAGRAMLQLLKDKNILNTAIFVVHFYGGKRIGAQRFDVIRQLSLTALQKAQVIQKPHNERRQTRSMSQRGRPVGVLASTAQRVRQMTGSALNALSNFQPTPVNSPSTSLTPPDDFSSSREPSAAESDNETNTAQSSYEDDGEDDYSEAHSALHDEGEEFETDQTGVKITASDYS